jgi:hypothetical protein
MEVEKNGIGHQLVARDIWWPPGTDTFNLPTGISIIQKVEWVMCVWFMVYGGKVISNEKIIITGVGGLSFSIVEICQ